MKPDPLFQKIDCLRIPVPDLEAGLAFYRDKLGHELVWRTETAAGLRMPQTDAEIVIQTERPQLEVNLKVASADDAAERMVEAGATLVAQPFDIPIGRCTVVLDRGATHSCYWIRVKGDLQRTLRATLPESTGRSGGLCGRPRAPSW